MTANPPDSLCILRLSALGDVCHLLPVVRSLQAEWPDTRLTWIVGKLEAQLLAGVEGVEFITFDKSAGWAAQRDLHRRLRGRRFDVLLHMQAAMRANLASLAVRAPLRVGFDRVRSRDAAWLFANRHIEYRRGEHVLESFFGFARALGVERRLLRWDIPIAAADRAVAAELLGDAPTLVINPCTSAKAKNPRGWIVERYARVAELAVGEFGLQVALSGGPAPAEREMAARIAGECRLPLLDLVGRTSLKQMLAVLQRARAVLAPDTGPAHMATAVGTPVIGLYMSTDPRRAGPYLSRRWTVDRYPDAIRRYFGKSVDQVAFGQRVRDAAAAELISVEDVAERLRALAAAGYPRGAQTGD